MSTAPLPRTPAKRTYQMSKRAQQEQATRLRIVESVVELHSTIGPSRTTIAAIANHANVRRSTVYRHFPDEGALVAACSSHWLAANPFPEIGRWKSIADFQDRVRAALSDVYGYYGRTGALLDNVLRDEDEMPILTTTLAGYRGYLKKATNALLVGTLRSPHTRQMVRAVVGHALDFRTWQSLTQSHKLSDAQAAELMCCLLNEQQRCSKLSR